MKIPPLPSIKTIWPWLACVGVLAASAAVDLTTHAYSQFFLCPATNKGTLARREGLDATLQNHYVAFENVSAKSVVSSAAQTLTSNGMRKILERPGRLVIAKTMGISQPDEEVVVATPALLPLGKINSSGLATLAMLSEELKKQPLPRSVRLVIYSDKEASREMLAGAGSIRAILALGSLSNLNQEKKSQSYQSVFGKFYPSSGDFLAFIAGPGGKGLTHVASSIFRRYSEVDVRCFKTLPPKFAALPDASDLLDTPLPYVLITDTGEFRRPGGAVDLSILRETFLGILKTVEGFASDSNPTLPTPQFPAPASAA